MADVRRVAKQPPAQAAKRAHQPKPQKVKEVVVPRPKPKPKPKKAQVEVKQEREDEHQYAELRPIRNSVHPYEPLSVETKETAPTDPAAVHLRVPEESELHYANVSVYREQPQGKETELQDKEIVAKENRSWNFFKQCHFPHWKIVLSALGVAAVIFALFLILLVLSAVSLSRANKNTDRYNELEETSDETAQQIAGQYDLLETNTQQMAQDIARLQQITEGMLLQNADRFERLETSTDQIKQDNSEIFQNISQQIITLQRQLDESTMTSGNASSTLAVLQERITQQEMVSRTIFNRTTMLETKASQLDASLAAVNETLRTLIDKVDTQVDVLDTSIDGLKIEIETLSATLNDTLIQLTKNGPFNCTSYIYQTVAAPNATDITSPTYRLEPNSVSNPAVTRTRACYNR